MAWHRQNDASQWFESILGVGIITATALAASVPNPSVFKSGRKFMAYLGLVPKQNSSGGKDLLGHILKMGNGYLRRLLIVGVTSVTPRASTTQTGNSIKKWPINGGFTSWLAKHVCGFLILNPGVSMEVVVERNGHLRKSEDFSFRISFGPLGCFVLDDLVEVELCDWIGIPNCTPCYTAKHLPEGILRDASRFLIDQNYDPRRD